MSDPFLPFREEFPILATTRYLISNSLGAMPGKTHEAMQDYTRAWAERGVRAWAEGWWDLPVEVGDQVAPILGAPSGTVTMHQNVTIAQQIILSCYDWSAPRNRIVAVEPDFPSVLYTLKGHERRGAEVVMVPGLGDGIGVDEQRICDAIDEKTRLVTISHVLFRSSFIVDIEPIVEKAHEVGAHVVWDVYQSAGSVPLDVKKAGVDFAVGGCLKWLCGGPGAGFLYVREDRIKDLEPIFVGWQADKSPFDFRPGGVDYRDDVWRFLNGTPQVPCLYACRPGLEILNRLDMEEARRKSLRQTGFLIEGARKRGWDLTVSEDPERRGGTVAFDVPHAFEVAKELLARETLIDYRPNAGIRVSPHFYNTDEECESLLSSIEEILESGAWKSHSEVSRKVT